MRDEVNTISQSNLVNIKPSLENPINLRYPKIPNFLISLIHNGYQNDESDCPLISFTASQEAIEEHMEKKLEQEKKKKNSIQPDRPFFNYETISGHLKQTVSTSPHLFSKMFKINPNMITTFNIMSCGGKGLELTLPSLLEENILFFCQINDYYSSKLQIKRYNSNGRSFCTTRPKIEALSQRNSIATEFPMDNKIISQMHRNSINAQKFNTIYLEFSNYCRIDFHCSSHCNKFSFENWNKRYIWKRNFHESKYGRRFSSISYDEHERNCLINKKNMDNLKNGAKFSCDCQNGFFSSSDTSFANSSTKTSFKKTKKNDSNLLSERHSSIAKSKSNNFKTENFYSREVHKSNINNKSGLFSSLIKRLSAPHISFSSITHNNIEKSLNRSSNKSLDKSSNNNPDKASDKSFNESPNLSAELSIGSSADSSSEDETEDKVKLSPETKSHLLERYNELYNFRLIDESSGKTIAVIITTPAFHLTPIFASAKLVFFPQEVQLPEDLAEIIIVTAFLLIMCVEKNAWYKHKNIFATDFGSSTPHQERRASKA